MARLLAWLSMVAVACCTGGPAWSADSAPPPWFGGRITLPGRGIAITFPDGWTVFDPEGDLEAQLAIAANDPRRTEGFDPAWVRTVLGGLADRTVILATPGEREWCGLQLLPIAGAEILGDEAFLKRLDEQLASADGVVNYVAMHPVDLPAGPDRVYLVEWRNGLHQVGYLIGGVRDTVSLNCSAQQPPEAIWTAIAESLAFIDPPVPSGVGGRVAPEGAGFALTFPDDWVVLDLSGDDRQALLDLVATSHPDWVDAVDAMLDGLTAEAYAAFTFHALALAPSTPDGWPQSQCLVQSLASLEGGTLDEVLDRERELTRITQHPDAGPVVSRLPDQERGSWRIDWVGGTETFYSLFLLGIEQTLPLPVAEVQLACFSNESVDPRWVDIAGTFELVP